MFPLTPAQCEFLLNPLKELPINTLFAEAIIEGKLSGKIYADDIANPKAYYIVHPYGMSLLYGSPERAEFLQALEEYITNAKQTRQDGEWLQVFPPVWTDSLKALRDPSGGVEEHVRVNLRFDPKKHQEARKAREARKAEAGAGIPSAGYEAVRLDPKEALKLAGTVVPKFFWQPEGDSGIAYAIISEQGEVASIAFDSCRTERQLEIGIETAEAFRGQGLAFEVCSALIDYSLQNGLEPVWACREGNSGSYALAQKLGFEPVFTLPYYRLPV